MKPTQKQIDAAAEAILNARAGRGGSPPVVGALEMLDRAHPSIANGAREDAEAAIAAAAAEADCVTVRRVVLTRWGEAVAEVVLARAEDWLVVDDFLDGVLGMAERLADVQPGGDDAQWYEAAAGTSAWETLRLRVPDPVGNLRLAAEPGRRLKVCGCQAEIVVDVFAGGAAPPASTVRAALDLMTAEAAMDQLVAALPASAEIHVTHGASRVHGRPPEWDGVVGVASADGRVDEEFEVAGMDLAPAVRDAIAAFGRGPAGDGTQPQGGPHATA